ncbi:MULTISPECIES: UbiH/UbiF/VisC/COQ6 family ubiquinone biosynthesis hydroxylase [unclassified Marinobacter]|uniref:UbiH/UbiF/VisC/COQ6 family ubiquinone biosynthesis hydroxylase n=1 Tax=unclassified Marinobacter TaxID=83889 RepID=UPI0026E14F91|nr:MULTISPECIES: UbiH/UbiF/VisC/COQ6 family ubiquinone biosynthesis hydroxylase [unclassified Marinobacter]MDO6441312.1 UbiH/UbiF/VisC/COQ6 family ubiquinone biosynthesis hydroxylase [Marinobacter sp. 2_MG-2023]MDO6822509.1 UbiH/UbiF/VisC/COQ6 family ubiquinone biosynthesis hydroxylase [Marinobacter sp. 1_MG-2023]
MSDTSVFDILVVGGGMTGTALALGLSRQGWRVGLIEGGDRDTLLQVPDAAEGVADFEPRVSAISVASQQLLESLGAWQSVVTGRHCPYQGMTVWDGDGTGRIHFDAAELQSRALGTIVENRSLVRALFEVVVASDVELIDGVQVIGCSRTGEQRSIELADGRTLGARLVIAADGANSRLRQWAGLPTREWDYDQQAIVCTVRTAQSHRYTAWQRFSQTGPLAFLPLTPENADEHFCSIVWSQDTEEARRLMALDDTAFAAELEGAIERELGAVEAVSKRFAFPLRQRHAKDYIAPGFALVGDAAHTIHPLAGQGANLGYGDVRVLLEELSRAKNTGLSPAHELVLARYQRRRKGDNLTMMAAMEGFKQLFGRDELPFRLLRNTGMRWLDGLGPVKNRIAAEAMGLRS